jgi:hypothetical protein
MTRRFWATAARKLFVLCMGVCAAATLVSCGFDSDQFINDFNNQMEDEGEIYYDPDCLDSDGDGWCD